jgi:hypothetical protein
MLLDCCGLSDFFKNFIGRFVDGDEAFGVTGDHFSQDTCRRAGLDRAAFVVEQPSQDIFSNRSFVWGQGAVGSALSYAG